MQKTIDNDALGIVQFLATVYDKDMSDEQIRAYIESLSDLPEESLRKASDEWTRKQKWFPKISELRDLAMKFSQTIKGGDAIIERLNHLYDLALDGEFVPEVWMKLILHLRVSDREELANSWRAKYDWIKAGMPDDPERRHKYAAWESVDEAAFNPETMRTIQP